MQTALFARPPSLFFGGLTNSAIPAFLAQPPTHPRPTQPPCMPNTPTPTPPNNQPPTPKQPTTQERPDAILPTMGGQTGLNLAKNLAESGMLDKYGVELIGAKLPSIDR